METHRSTRRLKRAELTEALSPTASKRRRRAFVRQELFELRSQESEDEPPLLLSYSDSSEKISVPSESEEIVSSNLSSSSNSGPLEPPQFSVRSDEDSVDVAKEKFDVVDRQQQAKSFETEASTCNSDFSRQTTLSSEAAVKSATMRQSPEKPTAAEASERRPPAAYMPSRAELESFFSAAEKHEQQRFAEKYNYDVVMDVPLEGRYVWICTKP